MDAIWRTRSAVFFLFGRYDISSFVFRSFRPFHPGRLSDLLDEEGGAIDQIIRSKGVFWLATQMHRCGMWSNAGKLISLTPGRRWAAAVPRAEWPPGLGEELERLGAWKEPWGDRKTELVVIGVHMDKEKAREALERCLLTDEEMELGPEVWATWEDPIADEDWVVGEDDDDDEAGENHHHDHHDHEHAADGSCLVHTEEKEGTNE